MELPQGYEGVVVEDAGIEDPNLDQNRMVVDPENENDEVGEVKILKKVSSFDNVVLWKHGSLVEGDDAFVKGLDEWIGFAEVVWSPIDTAFHYLLSSCSRS